jgi:Rod binding domain-containing protein
MSDGPLPLQGAPLPLHAAGPQLANGAVRPETSAASDELRRAAEEFEAVFLSEMLAPMFEGLDAEGLGGGGMGEQIFRPMLVERYAEAISGAGGVGVADSVVREMLRMQGAVLAPEENADGVDR